MVPLSAGLELSATKLVANPCRRTAIPGIGIAKDQKPGKFLPLVRAALRKMQSLRPTKPTAEMHYLTGVPERTCRHWLNSNVDIPASALVSLLHTEIGPEILAEVMRDTDAKWWPKVAEWKRKAEFLDSTVGAAQAAFSFVNS